MASFKEVRIRINSVKSTQQITSAMKMVAASKLRKTQASIVSLRPYAFKQNEILKNIISSLSNNIEDINNNDFAKARDINKTLIIVIASNKGLCGAFNSNILKEANEYIINNYVRNNKNFELLPVGKKSHIFFSKTKFPISQYSFEIEDNPKYEDVSKFADLLMSEYVKKKIDKIEIIYNSFINAATQQIKFETFLPIQTQSQIIESNIKAEYIFQPDKKEILNELIPKSLRTQFYSIALSSITSEHGARMTAMTQATENANTLIKELKLSYNKARQAAITNEIIDIVSGAEALK